MRQVAVPDRVQGDEADRRLAPRTGKPSLTGYWDSPRPQTYGERPTRAQ
jgi:hypothetical protein